ncbi:MAG: phosphatase [Proteobacteria bacterium]|nr:phosphatase [Pseudomonadota bacterium]
MRLILLMLAIIPAASSYADTMEHYMNIYNNIPQMEMKADQEAQAWARSARNVLTINDESIAETLLQANEIAKNQGKPLFCLPKDVNLNATILSGIIQQTYQTISSQQSDKAKMTVSQVALLGVTKNYPCQKEESFAQQMQHGEAFKPSS